MNVCVYVCLHVPQTGCSFFHLAFLIPTCSFLVGVWTGRLLPSALPEEAAGPTMAQCPGHHWWLSVCHLLSSQEIRWAWAISWWLCLHARFERELAPPWWESLIPSVPLARSLFFSLSSWSTNDSTTSSCSCWNISLSSEPDFPCPVARSSLILRMAQYVAPLLFFYRVAFPGLQRDVNIAETSCYVSASAVLPVSDQ